MKYIRKIKFHSMPWQIKLLLLMIAMAIIPSIIISYSITGLIENELKDNINGQLNFSSNEIASRIDNKIEQNIETFNLIKHVFEKPDLDPDQKVAFLITSLEKVNNILSITIATKQDTGFVELVSSQKDYIKKSENQLIETANNLDPINLSELKYPEESRYYFDTPIYNRKLNSWISTFVVALNLPNAVKSIMAAQIDFSELARMIDEHYLNKRGLLFVTDKSGKKFLQSKYLIAFPNFILNDVMNMLRGKNRVVVVTNYETEQNEKIVTCFSYPRGIDWAVVAVISEEIAYSVVNQALTFFLLFILISIVLSIITALWFSKHLSKPIIKMALASREIAGGTYDVSVDYRAEDSIGQLGKSLTSMGTKLKKNFAEIEKQKSMLEDYSKNLEKKVEERTNQLSESNRELKKAYQRVLELNEEKNEFLGIAAHDLKNPLIAISSFAEIIKEDKDLAEEQKLDFIIEIEEASKRMFFIIKNLLDVNAIEQGILNSQLEEIEINKIINDVVKQFQDTAARKNIQLEVYYQSENINALADANLLTQVIQNLLSNAIKFSPSDKKIFIKTCTNLDTDETEIHIKDEGLGFTVEDKKKLFNKFTRLSARPTGNEDSTGLGLSIVKKLVEMMNGKIQLVSEKGKGAEFIIYLSKKQF